MLHGGQETSNLNKQNDCACHSQLNVDIKQPAGSDVTWCYVMLVWSRRKVHVPVGRILHPTDVVNITN